MPETPPRPSPSTTAPTTPDRHPDLGGPFRAAEIRPGDTCELSHGHAIFCLPSSGRRAGLTLLGGAVVAWDPAVGEAGVHAGYSPAPDVLRAPDVAVGNVPAIPGWVPGAPALAIEYADIGQDEARLTRKIEDLIGAGTRWVWVVRLGAPRHVEVHAPGGPPQRVLQGGLLRAPGVLQNPVPVDALYDPSAAHRALLASLLQREGYASLESLRSEGVREGRIEGLQRAVRAVCDVLGIALSTADEAALVELRDAELAALIERLKRERRWTLP